MGSRSPHEQSQSNKSRRPRLATPESDRDATGLTMQTITPAIWLAAFPIAFVAAFLGYIISGNTRTIGVALVITLIAAVGVWALLRSQEKWRRSARITNEVMAGLLLACIGTALFIAGLAALSVVWSVAGLAILAGAWLVARQGNR